MTVAEIYTSAFIEAIEISVFKALGIMSIKDVIVTPRQYDNSQWSSLDYGFSYTVNVTCGLTPSEVISQLDHSMVNGDFLNSLKDNSGVAISSINSTTYADVTPKYVIVIPPPSSPPLVGLKRPVISSTKQGNVYQNTDTDTDTSSIYTCIFNLLIFIFSLPRPSLHSLLYPALLLLTIRHSLTPP